MSTTAAATNPATAGRASRAAAPASVSGPREFLAFRLGDEDYGIDILRVQEIRSYEEPTRVAGSPRFVKGVVNLRGVIVPIVDLRLKFGLDANYDPFTVVIVLNIGARIVGIVVDAVSDVISLAAEQMRAVPDFDGEVDAGHLVAIATLDERMVILVDIEKLMAAPEIGLGDRVAAD